MGVGSGQIGATATGYLGFCLTGAALLAIGTLTSTFTRNQVVAAVLAVAISVALWLVEFVGSRATGTFTGDFLTQLGL